MRCWISILISLAGYSGWALEATLDHALFKDGAQPYLEVYLHVEAASLTAITTPGGLRQAGVEVLLLLERRDTVVLADKYRLHGPATVLPVDFVDLKRYRLPDGHYQLRLELQDAHDPANKAMLQQLVEVSFPEKTVQQSSILLLAACYPQAQASPLQRNGRYMEPLPSRRYGPEARFLLFYNELYGLDQVEAGDILLRFVVQRLRPRGPLIMKTQHQRQTAAAVLPVIGQIDIERLPEGDYELLVEARRTDGTLLSRQHTSFERRHPFLGKDWRSILQADLSQTFVDTLTEEALQYSLRALTPLLPSADLSIVDQWIKRDSLQAQRAYLLAHWTKRRPSAPQAAYQQYMTIARAVDQQFQSGFRYGFESDRGYIYLKYGRPDDIYTQEEEPSAPPYEIWTYYDFPATWQSNVKFLFYNPSLVPGDFQLLHSTARGERNNPQWELELYRDAPAEVDGHPFDATRMKDNFNRNARRFFREN
jgi:GWxTD domain-containing protein